ncbi:MAG TPA: YbhB/YbcL family Raf kinase inhibitor-like protein [Planctomycetota bacterium]|nr:YbhB/YbcL family Raf kinase inhibitor-like protein [Planctomycetota bacterium]
MTLAIKSSAFDPNMPIPKKFTGEGDDVSPALQWSGIPTETKELALICDDPDAPTPKPWVHWVLYGVPPETAGLPENVKKSNTLTAPKNARQGVNDFGKIGYNGPLPPKGHGTHRYHFKLYALDAPLNLNAGLSKEDVLEAAKKHILAQGEVIGTYERK